MKPDVIASWPFPSDHRAAVYEVILRKDGTISCDCPGWVFCRKGQPRSCKHTKSVQSEAIRILRGEATPRQIATPIVVMVGARTPGSAVDVESARIANLEVG